MTDPGDGRSDDDFVDPGPQSRERTGADHADRAESRTADGRTPTKTAAADAGRVVDDAPETTPAAGESEAPETPSEPLESRCSQRRSAERGSQPPFPESEPPQPDTDVLLDRFASVDARLNTMNTVLRQQSETIAAMTERRMFARLTGPAERLAEIHDDLVADLAYAAGTDDAAKVGDLEYLLDGIVDVLESMGIAIVEVRSGDAYDAKVHRRTRFEAVDDPGLHRTVGTLPRAVYYYRFSRAEPPIVVAPAKVPVRKLSDDADRTAPASDAVHDV
ncbi:hypothetical protein ACEE18_01475 [Corynebacterium freneyi]